MTQEETNGMLRILVRQMRDVEDTLRYVRDNGVLTEKADHVITRSLRIMVDLNQTVIAARAWNTPSDNEEQA